MKSAYRVLAYLIAFGVVLQAAWMALGGFTMIKEVNDGLIVNKNYEVNFGQGMHGLFGTMVIPALAILLLIISFFAKVNGGVKWAAIVFGVVVLQIALAFLAFGATDLRSVLLESYVRYHSSRLRAAGTRRPWCGPWTRPCRSPSCITSPRSIW